MHRIFQAYVVKGVRGRDGKGICTNNNLPLQPQLLACNEYAMNMIARSYKHMFAMNVTAHFTSCYIIYLSIVTSHSIPGYPP